MVERQTTLPSTLALPNHHPLDSCPSHQGMSPAAHCTTTHLLLLVEHGLVSLYWDDILSTVCSAGEWIFCRDLSRSHATPCSSTARFCCLPVDGRGTEHWPATSRCLFATEPGRSHFRGRISPALQPSVKVLCAARANGNFTELCFRNETLWRVLGNIADEVERTRSGRRADALVVTEDERRKLEEMRRFLDTNPGEDCKFCERFALPTNKVKCTFKACYGETVYSYWKGVKLDHARRLLESGRGNVTEAAMAIGYDNPSHFAAAFKQRFGLPPKRYQTKHLRLQATV